MKCLCSALLLTLPLCSCSNYDPLKDRDLYPAAVSAKKHPGVTAKFYGNTTILVSDGETNILVDGFLTRPCAGRVILGKVEPDPKLLEQEFGKHSLPKLDAILLGHTHYDHALDTPAIAALHSEAKVFGSESYRFIHQGASLPESQHKVIPSRGLDRYAVGKFSVTFRPSAHATPSAFEQRLSEGDITSVLKSPARATDYKCGGVFVIHLDHPEGRIAITTTAGALAGQYEGLQADVLFLGVGKLALESEHNQENYWQQTVKALQPDLVVPTHWDDFAVKLSKGLKPRSALLDDVKGAIDIVKSKAARDGVKVRAIGLRESLRVHGGKVQFSDN